MGRAASKLTKPLRTYNIENRAAKELKKQVVNPKAAPKHPSTESAISQFQNEHPEFLQAQQTKHDTLNENLKKIYVDTKDAPIEIRSAVRPLPTSRKAVQDTDLGSMDIDYRIPDGKADLKTILSFIGQYQLDPEKVTPGIIADQHKLDEAEVRSILKYFKALQLHLPQSMYKENPSLNKIVSEQMKVASGTISQFRLSTGEKQKQLEGAVETDPPVKR